MFLTVEQNNSGGYYIEDEKYGIGCYIIIEADNIKEALMRLEQISDNYDDIINCRKSPRIRYDSDGVMVWNGKRCESKEPTEEEKREMEEILKEFGGDTYGL